MVEEFLELAESLSANPEIGRVRAGAEKPAVRECFLYSYRLIYEAGKQIDILAVIHGRRLLEAIEDRIS